MALPFDFFAPFDLDFGDFLRRDDLIFDFPRFVDLPLAEDAFALLFFAGRFAAGFARFFEGFLARLFDAALALAATVLTAFFAAVAGELPEAAARPAIAPITPPTTAPIGPATLPRTAPAAAPAVCFEIGGISMFSDDDELDGSAGG